MNLGFQQERAAALRIDPSFQISSYPQQNSFIDEVLHRTVCSRYSGGRITDVLPLGGDPGGLCSPKDRFIRRATNHWHSFAL